MTDSTVLVDDDLATPFAAATVEWLLKNISCRTCFRRRGRLPRRGRELGGRIHMGTEISQASFAGDGLALLLTSGDTMECSVVIVQIGFLSAKETLERLDLRLNDDGSIAIDPYFETSRHSIFAVGDVHGDIKLVTVAWAEGIQAAIHAFKEITSPYWLNEKRLRDHNITLIGEKIT